MRRLAALAAFLVLALASSSGAQNQGAAANHLATGRGSVPIVKTVTGAVDGSGTTASAIAAVTGKRLSVIGVTLTNTGAAAGLVTFRCGAGGTSMWQANVPATAVGAFIRDSAESGGFLFRCAAGQLVEILNAVAANAVQYNIRYVVED